MQAGVEVYSNFRELGEGDIDLKGVFDVLKSADYEGYLCGELDRSRFTNKESAIITMKYLCENW
jgi:sugar phosphate isomerase/epimerase